MKNWSRNRQASALPAPGKAPTTDTKMKYGFWCIMIATAVQLKDLFNPKVPLHFQGSVEDGLTAVVLNGHVWSSDDTALLVALYCCVQLAFNVNHPKPVEKLLETLEMLWGVRKKTALEKVAKVARLLGPV